jgi:hypothetical protein
MFLFKKSYRGDKWASRVPLSADVPCKVRKIYGVRFGAIIWDSSTDLDRALEKQELTNADLTTSEGVPLPLKEYNAEGREIDVHAFTNISTMGGYVGGSISWIKNVAVNFDKFEEGIDDLIFTAYADILLSPSMTIDDIVYTNKGLNGEPIGPTMTYSTEAVKTKIFGFRMGIDGRFNRQFSWSYGIETGYRPSLQGRSYFALLKISFPVFGTNLDYKVESFGK